MEVKISKDQLKSLAVSIVDSIGKSIQSSADAVIVPNRVDFLQELQTAFDSGIVDNVETAINKLSKIIGDMSTDFGTFSDVIDQKLVQSLKDFTQSREDANREVEKLRKENVIAETKIIKTQEQFKYGAIVLTQRQILEKQKEIISEEKQLQADDKQYQKDLKEYQKRYRADSRTANKLAERKQQLIQRREDINIRKEELNVEGEKGFLEKVSENTPDTLKEMGRLFTESLMAPVTAIKNVGQIFIDLGKGAIKLIKLFATMATQLVKTVASLVAATASFLATSIPFLLIGAAIITLGYGLYKLGQKLGLIDDPEKEAQDKISGTGKYQSLDEGTYDVFNEGTDYAVNATPEVLATDTGGIATESIYPDNTIQQTTDSIRQTPMNEVQTDTPVIQKELANNLVEKTGSQTYSNLMKTINQGATNIENVGAGGGGVVTINNIDNKTQSSGAVVISTDTSDSEMRGYAYSR